MDQTKILNIYTDGGSRGNPGPAALGVYIENETGTILAAIGEAIGNGTNNVAEYSAITAGFSWAIQNKNKMPHLLRINFFMDSQLATQQLNGIYKVKNPKLREFIFLIKQKEAEMGIPVYYSHIPREENKKADKLVNMALDSKII